MPEYMLSPVYVDRLFRGQKDDRRLMGAVSLRSASTSKVCSPSSGEPVISGFRLVHGSSRPGSLTDYAVRQTSCPNYDLLPRFKPMIAIKFLEIFYLGETR